MPRLTTLERCSATYGSRVLSCLDHLRVKTGPKRSARAQLDRMTLVHFYRGSRYPQMTDSEMPSPSPDQRVARLNPPDGTEHQRLRTIRSPWDHRFVRSPAMNFSPVDIGQTHLRYELGRAEPVSSRRRGRCASWNAATTTSTDSPSARASASSDCGAGSRTQRPCSQA
jgi:hypothetical protein